jgi:hypothetical protein
MRRTTCDGPKLAYGDKLYPWFSLYNIGLEAEIDLFGLTYYWKWFGGEKLKKIGGLLSAWRPLWRVGGTVVPPGSAWKPNKLFLLVGRPCLTSLNLKFEGEAIFRVIMSMYYILVPEVCEVSTYWHAYGTNMYICRPTTSEEDHSPEYAKIMCGKILMH